MVEGLSVLVVVTTYVCLRLVCVMRACSHGSTFAMPLNYLGLLLYGGCEDFPKKILVQHINILLVKLPVQ